MSVKLYKHRENGEVVAAVMIEISIDVAFWNGYTREIKYLDAKEFKQNYTPLPEAPEVRSTAWAVWMMQKGEKVTRPEFTHSNYWFLDGDKITTDNGGHCSIQSIHKDWQLYEEPKPIVECLPHEFVPGQAVLVRDSTTGAWGRRTFHKLYFEGTPSYGTSMPTHRKCLDDEKGIFKFRYCLPYAENSHLEGQITDGEHGAVPKGYVPPHVPKLGDDDYWQKGDEVVCLAHNHEDVIEEISEQTLHLNMLSDFTLNGCYPWINGGMSMRVLYHKGSYVREDGTVHEHVPTRPYKIIDTDHSGA